MSSFFTQCVLAKLPKNIAPAGRVNIPSDFIPYVRISATIGSESGKNIGARKGAKNAYRAES